MTVYYDIILCITPSRAEREVLRLVFRRSCEHYNVTVKDSSVHEFTPPAGPFQNEAMFTHLGVTFGWRAVEACWRAEKIEPYREMMYTASPRTWREWAQVYGRLCFLVIVSGLPFMRHDHGPALARIARAIGREASTHGRDAPARANDDYLKMTTAQGFLPTMQSYRTSMMPRQRPSAFIDRENSRVVATDASGYESGFFVFRLRAGKLVEVDRRKVDQPLAGEHID